VAKQSPLVANFSLGGAALEAFLTGITQNVSVELIQANCLSDTGPVRLAGTYDYSHDLEGNADFTATTGSDAVLFAQVANASGAAVDFDPTGAAAAADSPHYTTTASLLESYNITVALGSPTTFSATLQGNGALTRGVGA
jgi:hypothetical protein